MRRLLVLVVAVLAGAGCADATTSPIASGDGALPDRGADLVGTITTVTPHAPITEGCVPSEELEPDAAVSSDDPPVCSDPDSDLIGWILVEEDPAADREGQKASLTVRTSTTVVGAAGFEDLAEGLVVRAWFDGPVAESFPVQGGAAAVEVLGPGS